MPLLDTATDENVGVARASADARVAIRCLSRRLDHRRWDATPHCDLFFSSRVPATRREVFQSGKQLAATCFMELACLRSRGEEP